MATNPKLKLLCLHGYTQNSEVFRSRIGSIRKGLKSRLEFEFVQGPFESTSGSAGAEEEQGLESGGRSWWQWSDLGPEGRPSLSAKYSGWETTLDLLVEAVREHKPDGILGFSQGATASAMLLASSDTLRERLGAEHPLPRFAILISAFLPRDPSYAGFLQQQRPSLCPTLFVMGSSDALVVPERTEQLIATFDPACVHRYTHPGAHMVPTCSGDFKAAMVAFLEGPARGQSS